MEKWVDRIRDESWISDLPSYTFLRRRQSFLGEEESKKLIKISYNLLPCELMYALIPLNPFLPGGPLHGILIFQTTSVITQTLGPLSFFLIGLLLVLHKLSTHSMV